jgi:uncharacterized protein
MKLAAGTLALSPTDLANYLSCVHLTTLDLQVAMGQLAAPEFVPMIAEGLRERGEAHEQSYVDFLRNSGLSVVDLREEKPGRAASTKRWPR